MTNGKPAEENKNPRLWALCKECNKRTRIIFGRDSAGQEIVGPCYPCQQRKKPQ